MNYECQLGDSPVPTANKATLCEGAATARAGISILCSKNVAPPSRHCHRRLPLLLRDILDRETTPWFCLLGIHERGWCRVAASLLLFLHEFTIGTAPNRNEIPAHADFDKSRIISLACSINFIGFYCCFINPTLLIWLFNSFYTRIVVLFPPVALKNYTFSKY